MIYSRCSGTDTPTSHTALSKTHGAYDGSLSTGCEEESTKAQNTGFRCLEPPSPLDVNESS